MTYVLNLLLATAPGVIVVILGALFGRNLSVKWAVIQKRRELQLDSQKRFYTFYGEYLSLWRLWNNVYAEKQSSSDLDTYWWELFQRVTNVEGNIEALIVELTTERNLTVEEIETIGLFRQAYHLLRHYVRNKQPLPWHSSQSKGYVAFKTLSAQLGALVASNERFSPVGSKLATEQLLKVTDNRWEQKWAALQGDD